MPADVKPSKLKNRIGYIDSNNEEQSANKQKNSERPSSSEPCTDNKPSTRDFNDSTGVAVKSLNSDQKPGQTDHPTSDDVQKGQSSGKATKAEYSENGNVTLLPDTPTTPSTPGEPPVGFREEPRVFKKRWLMLLLFCLYSMSSAYHWIHLSIIGNILLRYFNESLPGDTLQQETAIDWLSMIYMLCYIPLIFPATWLLDKKGLRICVLCGCFLNCVGSWLKCGSVSPDRFPLLMFAQTTCAIAQVFVIGIPARLAAVWFGPNEVSTATSFGVFGNQLGVAVGFLLPPVMVADSLDFNEISHDLHVMFYSGATFATLIFIAIIFVFQNEPLSPPSLARMLSVRAGHKDQNYISSLFRLLKNWGFIILIISYGINTGCYYAISTLLNAIVLHYFEGEGKNAGRIGLTIILMGILGAIVAGLWLDKTKMYKATSLGIYIMSMVGMLVFTFTVDQGHIWLVFITAGALGLFMTGYLPVGFEFAAEITYPESEGTSSGLLNASSQVFGMIFTIGMRSMGHKVSMFAANITATVVLFAGTIMTAFIRADYKRQTAAETMRKSLDHEIEVTKKENQTLVIEPVTSNLTHARVS